MATEVGTLQASLSLDIKSFVQGMQQAVSLVQQLGQTLSQALGNTQSFSALQRQVADIQAEIALLNGAIQTLNATVNSMSAAEMFSAIRQHTAGLSSDLKSISGEMSKISAGGNLSGLNFDPTATLAGLQQMLTLAQQFASTMKTAFTSGGAGPIAQEVSSLQGTLSTLEASVKNIQQVLNETNLTNAIGSSTQPAAELQTILTSTEATLKTLVSLANEFANAFSVTTLNATNLQTVLSGLMAQFSSMASAMGANASNMSRMAGTTKTTSKNTSSTSSAMRGVANNTSKAATQADKMDRHLQAARGSAISVKGIIGGIIISQSFYELANIMKSLVADSIDFMNNMEQSSIAFSYLVGSQEGADSLLTSLQNLAIQSPITTAQATNMSRKLMAMGFSAKSVIPTLQTLTDASAVFTNSAGEMTDMMSHIVLALGQMKAAGKVSMQELRQLYNAGVPVFQMLQDGLGLTAEEVRNIGKLGIDSGSAIMAILTQMQQKYAGAAEAMTKTIPGALEVIKDSLYIINQILFAAPFQWVTDKLNEIQQRISAIVKIARVYGAGGIFQALFPKEMLMPLRNVMGTIAEIGKALSYIGKTVGLVFKEMMTIIVNVVSIVGPPIAVLVHALSQMLYWVMVNIPLVRKLLAIWMAYTVLTVVAKILITLAKALKLLTVAQVAAQAVVNLLRALQGLWAFSKVGFILMMIAGAFLAVALSSERAKAAIQSFFGKIQDASKGFSDKLNIGFDPNDIAQPEFNPPDMGDYDTSLKDMIDDWNDLADAEDEEGKAADDNTKKKKKQQSFLQSFDEVYTIKPTEDTDSGADSADKMNQSLQDLIDSMGDLNSAMDNMDWTGDFWTDWGNISAGLDSGMGDALDFASMGADFWKALVDAFKAPEWAGAGLGAIIGGLIGSLFGHPLIGAAIGALVGWIAGLFWEDFKNAFSVSDYAPVVAAISAAIAFVLGKLLGWGALKTSISMIGLALGSMVISALLSKIAEACGLGEYTSDSIAIGQGIGTLIGAAIGLAVGHPLIGAAIGNFAGGVVGLIWGALKEKLGVTDWQGIATVLGTAISAAFTGLANGFWATFIEPLGTSLGGAVQGVVQFSLKKAIGGGIVGAIAGLAGGLLTNALTGWIAKELDMGEDDLNNSAVGQSIGGLIGSVVGLIISGGNPIGAAIGNVVGQGLGGVIGLFWNDIVSWVSETWDKLSTWFGDVSTAFSDFMTNLGPNLTTFWENLKTGISNWATETWSSIQTWASNLGTAIYDGFMNLSYNVGNILGQAVGHVANFVVDAGKAIGNFFTVTIPNAWASLEKGWNTFWSETFPEVLKSIGKFFTDAGKAFVNFFTTTLPNAWTSFKEGWHTFWSVTFPEALQSIGTFFSDAGKAFINFFTETLPTAWDSFKEGWSNFWNVTFPAALDSIGEFFSNLWNTFVEWGGNVIQGFIQGFRDGFHFVWDAIGEFFQGFIDGFCSVFGINSPAESTKPLGENILLGVLEGFKNVVGSLLEYLVDLGARVIESIGSWFTTLSTTITTWATESFTSITTWCADTATAIGTWISERITQFADWSVQTGTAIVNWCSTSISNIASWVSTTAANIGNWVSNTVGKISSWASQTGSKVLNWCSTQKSNIASWVSNTSSSIGNWVSNTVSKISSWASQTGSKISSWASTTVSRISSAASSVASSISSGFSSAIGSVSNWASSTLSSIGSWCSSVVSKISSAVSSALSWLRQLFSAQRQASSAAASVSSSRRSFSTRSVMPMAASADFIPTTNVLARSVPMSGIAGSTVAGDGGVSGLTGAVATRSTFAMAPAFTQASDNLGKLSNLAKASSGADGATGFVEESFIKKFADSVGQTIVTSLMPMIGNTNDTTESRNPIYVGTLIADDRSLKELERKLKVIRVKEEKGGR